VEREVHYFADSAPAGRRLARALGVPARAVEVHRFPDAESRVRVRAGAGCEAVLVRGLHHPNAKLLEVLLAADALRRAGARRLCLVAPYLPYMRQDRVFRPGEALSQRVVGGLLGSAFDRVLTVQAHLHRVKRLAEVVPCRARSLSAAPLLGAWCQRRAPRSVLVGPDEESRPWVRAVAREAGLRFAVGEKERLGDRCVRLRLPDLRAVRHAVLVDDLVTSGTTLVAAARALRRGGVARVDALVVHALLEPGARERLRAAGVTELVSCDTVPHESNRLRTAPLLAAALG
jgi:ribose-phosphate pyrophosphokinase